MGKDKTKRFEENLTFGCLVQPQFEEYFRCDYRLKGHWNDTFFKNDRPIVLELGCGRGEYTVALARRNPNTNYIGIDIKGARMWRGAKSATEEKIENAGFLRSRIEFVDSFFAAGEVEEIWITFPDPQLKTRRTKKRLTSPEFLTLYSRILARDGVINLKTDSQELFEYTLAVIELNGLGVEQCSNDIYAQGEQDEVLKIKTTYEKRFIEQGKRITYIRFRLDSHTTFEAPPIDNDDEQTEQQTAQSQQ